MHTDGIYGEQDEDEDEDDVFVDDDGHFTHVLQKRMQHMLQVVWLWQWCGCGSGVAVAVVWLWQWCGCGSICGELMRQIQREHF
jgi:hypothetical protein